jgi:hypothetical protein
MIRSRSSWEEGGEHVRKARKEMNRNRAIGLSLGLMLAVGAGAASYSSARQAQRPNEQTGSPKESVRGRLAKLEADIDVLQVEREVVRTSLLDLLKKYDRLKVLSETDSMTSVGMAIEIVKEITGEDASKDKATAMALSLADDAEKKKIEDEASKQVRQLFAKLDESTARRKEEYWQKSKTLSENKQQLTELRKQYQTEARD